MQNKWFPIGKIVYIDPAIREIHCLSLIAGQHVQVVEHSDCPPNMIPVLHDNEIWYAEREYVRKSDEKR